MISDARLEEFKKKYFSSHAAVPLFVVQELIAAAYAYKGQIKALEQKLAGAVSSVDELRGLTKEHWVFQKTTDRNSLRGNPGPWRDVEIGIAFDQDEEDASAE